MENDTDNDNWERTFITPSRRLSLIVSLLVTAGSCAAAPVILPFLATPPGAAAIGVGELVLLLLFSFSAAHILLRMRTGSSARNMLLIVMPVVVACCWLAISAVLSGQEHFVYGGLFIVLTLATGVPMGLRIAFFAARANILKAAWDEMRFLPPPRQPWEVGQRHQRITERIAASKRRRFGRQTRPSESSITMFDGAP